MRSEWISKRITYQLEIILLEAILSVLKNITSQIIDGKEEAEEKF
jgi:hypothetical protein